MAASVPPSPSGSASGPAIADRLADLTVVVPHGLGADSRSAIAYYLLRDLVVTLELAPGAPLNERSLMDRLELGRTPVREALRRLADESLVTIFPRRGMVVAPIHVHDLTSISEVRVELEGMAARLAARRRDESDRQAAQELLSELASGEGGGDQRSLIRMDQRVHQLVHRATHNDYLQHTLTEYLSLSLRLWFLGLRQVRRLDEAVDTHRGLLTAVIDGDAEAAEVAAHSHVTGFWQEIRRVLSI